MLKCDKCEVECPTDGTVGVYIQALVFLFQPFLQGGHGLRDPSGSLIEERDLQLCEGCQRDFATKITEIIAAFRVMRGARR